MRKAKLALQARWRANYRTHARGAAAHRTDTPWRTRGCAGSVVRVTVRDFAVARGDVHAGAQQGPVHTQKCTVRRFSPLKAKDLSVCTRKMHN